MPTPVDAARRPDFGPLVTASESAGRNLKSGAIVIFESRTHTLTNVIKVVAGDNPETLDRVAALYGSIVKKAGVAVWRL